MALLDAVASEPVTCKQIKMFIVVLRLQRGLATANSWALLNCSPPGRPLAVSNKINQELVMGARWLGCWDKCFTDSLSSRTLT